MTTKMKSRAKKAGRPYPGSGHENRSKELVRNGILHFRRGELLSAEKIFRRLLESESGHPEALHYLGLIAHSQREFEKALPLLRKAIERNGAEAVYHYNLGNLLRDMGDRDAAADSFEKAISLKPDHFLSHNNLGNLYFNAGYFQEAEVFFRKAAELAPEIPIVQANLACSLLKQGKREEAENVFKLVLTLQPNHADAKHFLAVIQGDDTSAAPKEYVSKLFDSYADRFDSHLTQGLRYRTPQLLRDAVGRVVGAEKAAWRVLDLGCGTGLCGPLFRGIASYLKGVDLSPRMIEKARERQVYDELLVGELQEALNPEKSALDMAIAADVLVYIGDLHPVFAACHSALRDGGLFAFSVESFEGEGFILRQSGRFAHSARYIETLTEKHGFSIVLGEESVLRTEKHKPIAGHLYVLCKGKAAPQPEDLEVSFDPANIPDAYESALLHHRAGQLAQAEGLYRLILRHQPDHADAMHYLGVLAHQTGHSEAAVDLITQAIAKNPSVPAYHTNLGLALHAQGKLEEAVSAMRKALELNPANVNALNNLAYFLKLKNELDEATVLLQRAVILDPAFAEGHNNLANIYWTRENLEEAERHYKRAAESNPEYADVHRNLAGLLQAQGRHAEAAASWRRLLKLRPEDAGAQARLAECESKA